MEVFRAKVNRIRRKRLRDSQMLVHFPEQCWTGFETIPSKKSTVRQQQCCPESSAWLCGKLEPTARFIVTAGRHFDVAKDCERLLHQFLFLATEKFDLVFRLKQQPEGPFVSQETED